MTVDPWTLANVGDNKTKVANQAGRLRVSSNDTDVPGKFLEDKVDVTPGGGLAREIFQEGTAEEVRFGLSEPNKLDATVAPGASNDSSEGYGVNSHWIDAVAGKVYVLLDPTVDAAVWKDVTLVGVGSGGGETTMAISADDTTPGTVEEKFVTGGGLFLSTLNEAGNEQRQLKVPVGIIVNLDTWVQPSATKAEIPGVDTGGGSANYEGNIKGDGMEDLIKIILVAPTGPDLAKFDDGGGNYIVTVQDDGVTDSPTPPNFTTGQLGQGLVVELNQFGGTWDLDGLVAAIDTWAVANLSAAVAIATNLNPVMMPDEVLWNWGMIEGDLAPGLSNTLRVAFTTPTEQDIYDFNCLQFEAVLEADMGEVYPGFAIGVRAAGGDLPADSTVDVHKYVAGGPEIRTRRYGLVGMLCLCGPTANMTNLKDAIEAAAPNATVTILTGIGTDLCGTVYADTASFAAEAAVGSQSGLFSDFPTNGGLRWRRRVRPDPNSLTEISVQPPSTYLRS